MAGVTFDGPNKLMIVDFGVTEIDVQRDFYSGWKVWAGTSDNLKFARAMRSVGGDEKEPGVYLGSTFFLVNGWKCRPHEASHRLVVDGNLYVDGGGSPFVDTLGAYTVVVELTTSNIIDLLYTFTQTDRDSLSDVKKIVSPLPSLL